jgi:hypothetical protein
LDVYADEKFGEGGLSFLALAGHKHVQVDHELALSIEITNGRIDGSEEELKGDHEDGRI